MGSLYDNSGEDIYARRDIEKRRKHAMAMKKKRKRQILKRKIMLFKIEVYFSWLVVNSIL